MGVNRQPFMNFMSKNGTPSRPHVILFATRSADGKPTAIPADMIARANYLLSKNNDVFTALKSRVDCVIVDEFQDTNPLQFSLVWLLAAAGIPTLIVGD